MLLHGLKAHLWRILMISRCLLSSYTLFASWGCRWGDAMGNAWVVAWESVAGASDDEVSPPEGRSLDFLDGEEL